MSAAAPSAAAPTPADVRAVAALRNPILRNLRITECYYRLSAAMASRTDGSANWCTFATWASRQAGRTIRAEDFMEQLSGVLASASAPWLHPVASLWRWLLRKGIFEPESRLGRLVHDIHSPFDAFERASDAVARGNRKVFEEIGLEFARYLEACPRGLDPGSEEFKQFLSGLRPGAPPDGQDLLRSAFLLYQNRSAEGTARRAQQLFKANLEIGLHEQTRLQPEIREAIVAGPETAENLGRRLLAHFHLRLGPAAKPAAIVMGFPAKRFREFVDTITCRVITECLMVLRLSDELLLALGKHLDRPFPSSLEKLDEPELEKLLREFEPAEGAVDNCGANDWSALPERMHYIIHLFRCFHDARELFEAPFTSGQVAQIMEGRIPDGRL